MDEQRSLIGQSVGNYRIARTLGVGGMGAVYLGEHPEIGSKVAIKVLLPRFVTDPRVARRFLDEARAVNRIEHNGIVRIHDCGRQEGLGVYLVMEHLEGETLKQRLVSRGPFAPRVAVRLLAQTASALIASHAAGIVHRDLKPANIFIISDPDVPGGERVKILDFGIAKLLEEREPMDEGTKTGMVLGSPLFMSPEQCIDPKRVDLRTDIYSLGAIAFHLLTGSYPYQADTLGQLILKQQQEGPVALRSLSPSVGDALAQVIHRALETNLERRFQTMRELLDALQEVDLDDAPAVAPEPSSAPLSPAPSEERLTSTTLSGTAGEQQPAPRRRASLGLVATGVILAAGLIAGAIALLRGPGADPTAGSGGNDATRILRAAPAPDSRPPPRPAPTSAPAAPVGREVRVVVKLSPASAVLLLDGRRTQKNSLVLERSRRPHVLRATARGHLPQVRRFVADVDKTLIIALKKREPPAPPAAGKTGPAARPEAKKATKKGPYFDDL